MLLVAVGSEGNSAYCPTKGKSRTQSISRTASLFPLSHSQSTGLDAASDI